MKVAKGVNLYTIPSQQFKTTQILIRFREDIQEETVAKRVLLANLFETSNVRFQKSRDFQAQLASMYGSSFSADVTTKGRQHFLTLGMTIVDPLLVGEDLLGQAFDFLQTVIFSPLASGGRFDEETFALEKMNMLHYLAAIRQDHDSYASLELDRIFYEDKNQGLPAVATSDLVEKEEARGLYAYYQEMLKENVIDILVLGNVNPDKIQSLLAQWDFSDRPDLGPIFYSQAFATEPQRLVEEVEGYQSVLNLAWDLPVQFGDEDYLAAQVFNGLFGSLPHSKLFAVVRERESLAYGIGSEMDFFTGLLKVSAGIDKSNYEKTTGLIHTLLEDLQAGQITDQDLSQTKDILRSAYYMGRDYQSRLIEQEFIHALLPERSLGEEAWLAALEAVTRDSVKQVANKVNFAASFFLRGEKRHA